VAEINQYGQVVGDPLPEWRGAGWLERKTLTGRRCRLEPLNAVRHAADLFEAFALVPDDHDWTWLASERPASVAATRAWLDESNFDDQGQQLHRLERFRE